MMKTISLDAGLSKCYTNHCVRATTITRLAHAGVETREIMKISGHRSEASVKSYHADSSENQKRKYSSIIHGIINVDETSALIPPNPAKTNSQPTQFA
jgi:integrase